MRPSSNGEHKSSTTTSITHNSSPSSCVGHLHQILPAQKRKKCMRNISAELQTSRQMRQALLPPKLALAAAGTATTTKTTLPPLLMLANYGKRALRSRNSSCSSKASLHGPCSSRMLIISSA